jgi:hypothetical protein
MRRVLAIAFSILMACFLLLGTVVRVQASAEGYDITEAYSAGGVDLDGQWGETEWDSNSVWVEYIDPYDARFGYKMAMGETQYYMSWILDFPDDTDDAGDVWQICLDGTAAGGTAPTTDCNKIEITGDTLAVYVGDGAGWEEMEGADVLWAKNFTTTGDWASYAEDHYVVEVMADKGSLGAWGANPPPEGLRVAHYDADNDTWIQWPPESDQAVPDGWGLIADYGDLVPESLSLGVIVLLSTAAAAITLYFFHKRPKTASYSGIKHLI